MNNIRNFCIIAHIDHGKSTLADRFLELTGTVERRKMREQYLDQMDLEREKGITIKMQPVRMIYHPDRGNNADLTRTNAENMLTNADLTRTNAENMPTKLLYEDLTYKIRGLVFKIKQSLGLGHKEHIYHNALELEFKNAGLKFESKKNIPVVYQGNAIGSYQPDFVVENKIVLELKALPEIGRPQMEQVWSYLKGCEYKLALLVNFGSKDLEIKRIIYDTARSDSALGPRGSAEIEHYVLNLIDTPGHVDFSYEVSRSLAAVEGAILLVDATKGVQAQTLANLNHAKKQNLVIIPAVNKIDAPLARTREVTKEISELLGVGENEIFHISAKEGTNVEQLLRAVIEKVPPPEGSDSLPLRALIFDSKYDTYKGIIAYARLFDGTVSRDEQIVLVGTGAEAFVKETGYFLPQDTPVEILRAGEIGYIATGIKDPEKIRIGDTVTLAKRKAAPLPGYQTPKPMVFVSFYPQDPHQFNALKDALMKLRLNDPSLTCDMEAKEALGRGFRCGFLGVLHSEIISERIQREFHIEMIISRPSVEYVVVDKKGKKLSVKTPADWPEPHLIEECYEPVAKLEVIVPLAFFSQALKLVEEFHGRQLETKYLGENKLLLIYEVPLREIIGELHDALKSATQGLASMDYEIMEHRKADLVKLDIAIAGRPEAALATIAPRERAYQEGKMIVEKLKEVLPPQQYDVPLQAVIGGKVIARETITARRKDVTAPLYGGDVTRKRKLLEKQKKGKKELKEKGRIAIPSRVFLEIFKK